MHHVNSFELLGVKVSGVSLERACAAIEKWVQERCKTYVCVAPVSMIIDCQRNDQYRRIINEAGMTTPDGMPLVWIGRLRGEKSIQRTYGPDLMLAFCQLSQTGGYRHYFYGGDPKTNNRLMERLKNRFPGIKIVGNFSPPLRGVGELEQESVMEGINHANPDILWVGLGSPKQDYWMHNHRGKLNVPVMVGVGAAFDFIAGTKPQAPRWMQRAGLEWFFRLCCEPRRLWKRYLIGNSRFIWYLFCDSLKRKCGQKHDP